MLSKNTKNILVFNPRLVPPPPPTPVQSPQNIYLSWQREDMWMFCYHDRWAFGAGWGKVGGGVDSWMQMSWVQLHLNPTLQLQPLSPSPTPTSSFTHPPVMTAHGHMNIICIQLQPLSPSPTPPTTLHPLLTCHDITMTCERRWHPAVTPLSLPHPTPTTSFTHSPVITAWVYVNVVCIQLWSLSPSPTPPPLPASHTHLS